MALLTAVVITGCATSGSVDMSTMATIYIYRAAGGVNGPYPKVVMLDGKPIGKLVSNGYFVVTVEPGVHVISTPAANLASVAVDAEKGEAYYLSQEIIPTPPIYHVLLNRVSETLGRQAVARGRRLAY